MESKEIKIERMMYRFYNGTGRWMLLLLFVASIVFLLTSCRSTQVVSDTQHTTRDSVIYTYKTVLRDSIRIRDSVRIVTKTKVRDSVVLRIDNNTGDVVSREAWHWQDTDNNRDHLTDVGKMVSKADSVGTERIKKDSAVIISKTKDNVAEVKKTHYWKTWWFGVLCGISISLCWKYRKTIVNFIRH